MDIRQAPPSQSRNVDLTLGPVAVPGQHSCVGLVHLVVGLHEARKVSAIVDL
jgi:hypothetical protein